MSELVEVKTIGEVERIVHGSGQWNGNSAVEFSNDAEVWSETWAPTVEHPLPTFARVTVHRKGVDFAAPVTIRWDEQVPRNDEFWAAKWVGAPMRHFGRTVRMVAFRQAFRDLLGDIVIEDEDRASTPVAEPAERDWRGEILAADTVDALDKVVADARKARVFKPTPEGTALDRLWKTRRNIFQEAAEIDALIDRFAVETPLSRAKLAEMSQGHRPEGFEAAVLAFVATGLGPVAAGALDSLQKPVPARREPQDYRPGNRAARRAAKRGGRR